MHFDTGAELGSAPVIERGIKEATRRRIDGKSVMGLAACGVVLAACSGCGGQSGTQPPDYAEALRGAPPPLARVYGEGDRLLRSGEAGLGRRLKELRGYPVVVNLWASWCGGCIEEMRLFQAVSARFGTRVAFVGVNSDDSESGARELLERSPLPYPSYVDPGHAFKELLGARGYPDTAFYDRRGRLIFLRQGQYASEHQLTDDIQRFALGTS